jgi:hypothetical protein
MKTIFLLAALGLAAGVRAAPVPRAQALTRNVGDKLHIRECTLVRRGDWEDDDLSSEIATQLPDLELERAARRRAKQDIYKANRRAKQALLLQGEDAEATKIRKAKETAYRRDRRQKIAQDPALSERQKTKKSIYNKSHRLLAEAKSKQSARVKLRYQAEKAKRQALTEALVTGSPSTQLAASRLLAEVKAKQSARQKLRYQAKKAKRQALTEALVTGSPSTQLAASRILAEDKANISAANKRYQQAKKAKQQALNPCTQDFIHVK